MPRIPRRPQPEATSTPRERIMASLGEPVPASVDAGGVRVGDPGPPAPAEPTNAEVREWARANGHDVSDSGPVPKAVREAYTAAHDL
jgi:hypothetical protein